MRHSVGGLQPGFRLTAVAKQNAWLRKAVLVSGRCCLSSPVSLLVHQREVAHLGVFGINSCTSFNTLPRLVVPA
jgi:hypothetical protein